MGPGVNAAAVIAEYAKPFGEQDINTLAVELGGKFEQVEKYKSAKRIIRGEEWQRYSEQQSNGHSNRQR